jgi:GDPmannose 4,6-dehydratase
MPSDFNKVALISGVTGQDGSYLAEFLLDKGYEVHGIKRRSSSLNTSRIDHIYQDPHVGVGNFQLHYGDVTDTSNLISLIDKIKPSEIYNLAAQSHVQVSFESPEYTANADALGVTRFLEAIRTLDIKEHTRFYQASSSEMFGLNNGQPLNESSPFYPRSPYAVAKLYGYWITKNYREAYGIFASNGILFNHESPRRGETFVTQKIVQAAARIFKGSQEILFLGNLDSVRDWGHAKDYVDSMWRILQFHNPDDWVIATGETMAVREFTEIVFKKIGILIEWVGEGLQETGVGPDGRVYIKIDSRYFRPTEVPHLLGDSTKARALLEWKPQHTIHTLIDEMLSSKLS